MADKSQVPEVSNILHRRFKLSMKDETTMNERYEAHLFVLEHRDMENAFIIHSSVPVRMRSVRILITGPHI